MRHTHCVETVSDDEAPRRATRTTDQIWAAYRAHSMLAITVTDPNQPTQAELEVLAEAGYICGGCHHDAVGLPAAVIDKVRKLVGLSPQPPRCSDDDGAGGGFEHSGGCSCRGAFHSRA